MVVIGEKYAYELDRSVPKIGRYLGDPNNLVFPTVEVSLPSLATDSMSSKFTITAIENIKGINRIEIWLLGTKIDTIDGKNEHTVTTEYTATVNGEYTIKAYADLSANETVNVTGIIPAVSFSPNGSDIWAKQHTTKISVIETTESITSMKYKWSKEQPEEEEFNKSCNNGETITGGPVIDEDIPMTGVYYLYVLATIGTGENKTTAIYHSNGFKFDNTAPTAELKTEWIDSKLKISLNNVQDAHSNINENAKIYVTPQNGTREEKEIHISGRNRKYNDRRN